MTETTESVAAGHQSWFNSARVNKGGPASNLLVTRIFLLVGPTGTILRDFLAQINLTRSDPEAGIEASVTLVVELKAGNFFWFMIPQNLNFSVSL